MYPQLKYSFEKNTIFFSNLFFKDGGKYDNCGETSVVIMTFITNTGKYTCMYRICETHADHELIR